MLAFNILNQMVFSIIIPSPHVDLVWKLRLQNLMKKQVMSKKSSKPPMQQIYLTEPQLVLPRMEDQSIPHCTPVVVSMTLAMLISAMVKWSRDTTPMSQPLSTHTSWDAMERVAAQTSTNDAPPTQDCAKFPTEALTKVPWIFQVGDLWLPESLDFTQFCDYRWE